ncbi:pupal cuticle protein 20-like [Euwallacea similis]|uniref:pupal cuticle protein 20-like n=1 Tax=Euwallacea similis TaxID=1736056 RepID=UPI00344E4ABB
MKHLTLSLALLGFCACARLNNVQYLPPSQRPAGGIRPSSGGFGAGGTTGFGGGGDTTGFGGGSTAGFGGGAPGKSGSFGGGQGFGGGASSRPGAGGFGTGAASGPSGLGGGSQGYGGAAAGGYNQGGGRPGAGSEIPIIRYENVNNGDGTYQYLYETGNGINAQEQGDARGDGTQAQGSFSYTAPDGQQIQIQYTADENGFNPQGPHIPTPPPIPAEIQRSIEQNLADEARGIVDDGAYRPGADEGGAGGYSGGAGGFKPSGGGGGGFRPQGGAGGFRPQGGVGGLGSGQSPVGGGYRY